MTNPIGDPFLRREKKEKPPERKKGGRKAPVCKQAERSFRDPRFLEILGKDKGPA